MFIGFKAIATGASHKEAGMPLQDDALCFVNNDKTFGIAIVADGHGGKKYIRSEHGSKIAVNISSDVLQDFYKAISAELLNVDKEKMKEFFDKNLKKLEQDIIMRWRNAVLDHYSKNPLTSDEEKVCNEFQVNLSKEDELPVLYGSTLIAALVTTDFWFAIQIGDGLCVLLPADASPQTIIPDDPRLAFGRTTSLCDYYASENFRHNFGFEQIQGITVATDGVVDSFDAIKYVEFNAELRKRFVDYPDKIENELQTFLPELSARGSRDDVAIAGIFNLK